MDIHDLNIDLNILMDCLPEYFDPKVKLLLINDRFFITHSECIIVMLPYHYRYTEYLLKQEIRKRFEVAKPKVN